MLNEQRFAEASVTQIIREAAVSRASFYHYFSSKLAIVAGLLSTVMDEIFALASPFLNRPGTTVAESLQISIHSAMETWAHHRPLLRLAMENWPSLQELERQWMAIMERFTFAVAAEIDQQRDAGRLPAGLGSHELAQALIWSTERCLYIAGRDIDLSDADESTQVEVLVTLWTGALQAGRLPA